MSKYELKMRNVRVDVIDGDWYVLFMGGSIILPVESVKEVEVGLYTEIILIVDMIELDDNELKAVKLEVKDIKRVTK